VGEKITYADMIGKLLGKRLLCTPKLRWEYNIEIDSKEAEREGLY
jgi:hypothetical protein